MEAPTENLSVRHLRPCTLILTLNFHRTPVCPVCADLLQPFAIVVKENVAICSSCAYLRGTPSPNVVRIMHDPCFLPHVMVRHGILWFSPDVPGRYSVLGLAAEIAPVLLPLSRPRIETGSQRETVYEHSRPTPDPPADEFEATCL